MKKLLMVSLLVMSPLMLAPAHAESSTKVTFMDGSYCGSFTGNIYNGKTFRLWLSKGQRLVIKQTGDTYEQVNIAYVKGPSGRINAMSRDTKSSSYDTDSKGNHYIKVYGNSSHSSVEFCAYEV